jgi:putative phosphoesterase
MKIAIIADTHANLPALKAALNAVKEERCDSIFHVGDAIAIGPYPAECVDLMHNTPNLKCVKGNHELFFLNGLPKFPTEWWSEGELQHQRWTHAQLGAHRQAIINQWPMLLEETIESIKTIFLHYGLTEQENDFHHIVRNPNSVDLDRVFEKSDGEIIFFGHDHLPLDVQGKARYINPGSLGCCPMPLARYTIAEYKDGLVNVQHRSVTYDDTDLYRAFESRDVPEREIMYKAFFGGRFEVG